MTVTTYEFTGNDYDKNKVDVLITLTERHAPGTAVESGKLVADALRGIADGLEGKNGK